MKLPKINPLKLLRKVLAVTVPKYVVFVEVEYDNGKWETVVEAEIDVMETLAHSEGIAFGSHYRVRVEKR